MDHDRMDPRDRGMSGAEGPPPPPRSTNHRQSESRDRRSGKFKIAFLFIVIHLVHPSLVSRLAV